MSDGLKLLSLEVNNFKNITHKRVEFDGRSVFVVGRNGAGKSSFIQAVTSAINSKAVPQKPITEGEEKAVIELTLGGNLHGEEMLYNISMHFSEKDQKGRFVITDAEGNKVKGGKSMIDSIVGNVGFDILEFINLGLTKDGKPSKAGVKQQIEILKTFLPLEARKSLNDLETERAVLYSDRTTVNSLLKSYKAKFQDAEMDPAEIEKYSERLNDSEIKKQMGEIGEAVSKYDSIRNKLDDKKRELPGVNLRIEELKKELAEQEAKKASLEEDIKKGEAWMETHQRPSMENLNAELTRIEEHNKMHDKVQERHRLHREVVETKNRSDKMTERLNEIEKEKKDFFSVHPLPVKNLTFDEEEILYKGLPFNENQHPSSTIIGVGLQIAMAMNPNLRLLVINDGSLLDKKVLGFILKQIESKGYQALIEVVDHEGEKDMDVEFIETQV